MDLSANQLQGVIPSDLGGLSSLLTLNLSDNSLGGSIPSNLGNLSNLTGLNLSDNELDWEIPEELNRLDKLQNVSLNGNLGLIGPAHLDFTELSKVHLGHMETETWAVADFSSAPSWSISGADSGKFSISGDGVLTFGTAPDYETESSSNATKTYSVDVKGEVGGTEKTAEIEVTVIDRDIALSVSPDSIVEEGTSTQFTITATLDGTTQITDTTISLSLSGTATGSGTDYTTVLLPSEMTIFAGDTTGTATLTTIRPEDDAIVEGEETISIEGTFSNDTVSPAWITINDADQGKLSLSGSVTAASEGGNDASYTVTLSHAIGHKVTVGWSLTPDSGDFSTPSGTVTFVAGSTAGATITLTLTPTDDLLSEVEESFSVMLGTITGEISDSMIVDTQANSAGLTIDASDPITVTLSGDSSVDEGESASYTVSLDGVTPTEDLTVDYDTADDTAGSADYAGVSETQTLTFTSSDAAAKTVTVQTTEDSIAEGDETFSFTLSNVADGGGPTPSLGDPSSITTTIIDDDRPLPPRDRTRPRVTITSAAAAPVSGPFAVRIRFSESVYGFSLTDIAVRNGTASHFRKVSSRTYTATITPEASGAVRVEVGAHVARDRAGNGNRPAEPFVIAAALEAALQSRFESPADGVTVSGIDLIRGWTFAEAAGVGIAEVVLYIDGQRETTIPCCSVRQDVQAAYPDFPAANTAASGWGLTYNWGTLAAGAHSLRVVATSSQGVTWESADHTIRVLKPGEVAFADRLSLATAAVWLEDERLVLDGVVIRDKASQQEQAIEAHYGWRTAAQGLWLLETAPLETASLETGRAPGQAGGARLLAELAAWGRWLLSPARVTATPGITAAYEAPADQAVVAGIGLIRGWAFADIGSEIATVTLRIDGAASGPVPCCSERARAVLFRAGGCGHSLSGGGGRAGQRLGAGVQLWQPIGRGAYDRGPDCDRGGRRGDRRAYGHGRPAGRVCVCGRV